MPLRCFLLPDACQMPLRCLHKPLGSLSDASQMSPQRDMLLRCLPDASSMRYASQMPFICLLNEICLSDASQKPLRCFSYAFSMSFRNMKCMILGTRATCICLMPIAYCLLPTAVPGPLWDGPNPPGPSAGGPVSPAYRSQI